MSEEDDTPFLNYHDIQYIHDVSSHFTIVKVAKKKIAR